MDWPCDCEFGRFAFGDFAEICAKPRLRDSSFIKADESSRLVLDQIREISHRSVCRPFPRPGSVPKEDPEPEIRQELIKAYSLYVDRADSLDPPILVRTLQRHRVTGVAVIRC